jgi:nicotinate phosphoribosyltransferase
MSSALLTDLYELTMMQGYFLHRENHEAVFDMFYRRQPFGGGFAVFAGLQNLLETLERLEFKEDDLEYLATLGIFKEEFLDYLKGFRFRGDVYSVDEGTIVFPNEPLLRVHGPLIEAQLIESLLLNIINFQTLVATKTARIYLATGEGIVLEFGLRRAQGPDGAMSAARAAFIGGAAATSNTLAGKLLDIPVKGTMAHSWVMAFGNELESFRKYAEIFPDSTILLIDTYDTLTSGIENAVKVGLELKKAGHRNFGIRLDSGDLSYLSKEARKRLDEAGLTDAKIAVSNELDEQIIHELKISGAPIDIWGVGTNLVTAGGDPSLTGVYKLVAKKNGGDFEPTIKVSNNPSKVTNPGVKQVYRFYDRSSAPLADLLTLVDEPMEQGRSYRFFHPMIDYKQMTVSHYGSFKPLLSLKMKEGRIASELPNLRSIQAQMKRNLSELDPSYKRLMNPHEYKISLSENLKRVKDSLIAKYTRI